MSRQGDLLQRERAQDEGGWREAPAALLGLEASVSIISLSSSWVQAEGTRRDVPV